MKKKLNFVFAVMLISILSGCSIEKANKDEETKVSEVAQVQQELTSEREYEDTLINKVIGMKPTVVCVQLETEKESISASGFIIEISNEAIYVCTNKHVINEYDVWNVSFFDGTQATAEKIGVDEVYDVGVIKVAKSEIAEETLEKLCSVKIDLEYWESIGIDELELGMIRIGSGGEILHTKLGVLVRKEIEFLWGSGEMETELSIELAEGDSGSALFDKDGRLISMAFGTSKDVGGERHWGVPLDAIISSYQEITGRTL